VCQAREMLNVGLHRQQAGSYRRPQAERHTTAVAPKKSHPGKTPRQDSVQPRSIRQSESTDPPPPKPPHDQPPADKSKPY
jgi:hypothetical protein